MTPNRAKDQEEGILGRLVGGMIRRSVRSRFRGIYWIRPEFTIPDQAILVPNHHGWHDGYMMYNLAQAMDLRFLDWIEEFGAFPLFGKVGGMPYPADSASIRAGTIKKTIRLMKNEKRSLLLFAEGVLHRPPELWAFGKSLELMHKHVPEAVVLPIAIKYDMSMHERPECFIHVGKPLEPGPDMSRRARLAVKALLDELAMRITYEPERFETLVKGVGDVNERWDIRKMPGATPKPIDKNV